MLVAVVVLVLIGVGAAFAFKTCYVVVPPGFALVISGFKGCRVSMSSGVVWPVIQKGELIDITSRVMSIQRREGEGLICMDNLRADVIVEFTLRINPNPEDILMVARAVGCSRAMQPETLEALFAAKFSEALKIVGKQEEFADAVQDLDRFKGRAIDLIGTDLNGYLLEDVAIAQFEQTAVEMLDPNNILDAQGIRKITEITAQEALKANHLEREQEKQLRNYARRNPELVRHIASYLDSLDEGEHG